MLLEFNEYDIRQICRLLNNILHVKKICKLAETPQQNSLHFAN